MIIVGRYLHELSGDLPAAAVAYAEAAHRAANVAERDHLIRQAARTRRAPCREALIGSAHQVTGHDRRGPRHQEKGSGRAWVPVDRDGHPVAVMVIDGTLAEDPELVRTAASATVLAVENGNLEGALRDSRARILAAGHDERRRIERDIHDSPQQRLVALRIHLSLAGEQLDGSEQRAMVAQLGTEVDEAIDDLRSVAAGVYPVLLTRHGVATALRSVSRHAAIPVIIKDRGLRRYPQPVELAVYFCCLEAMQNAAKHAGPGAAAAIELSEDDGFLRFTVEDDGVGFDPRSVRRGSGLANIADRMSAAGGTVRFDSTEGTGTRVHGQVLVSDPVPVGRALGANSPR